MISGDPFSVLIPDGESPQALGVVRCLSQIKNIKIYLLSNKSWPLTRFSRYPKHFISYKTDKGNEGRLNEILSAVNKTKADVVLPADANTIGLLTEHCSLFSKITSLVFLPHPETFKIASNKWLLAKWAKENQVPCPPTILYQTKNNLKEILPAITFPVLIKPAIGSNGKGIKYFSDAESLKSFLNKNGDTRDLIIQSFITGYDIDCSVLCREGEILAYTIQKTFREGARRFGVAAGVDFLYDDSTYKVVKDIIQKLNWSGIVHIDLRYDEKDQQVKVIEMNPRYWGSVIGSLHAGVNFPYMACLAALGGDLPKVMHQPTRFVNNSLAIQIMLKRFFHKNYTDLYFDHSKMEFLLKDPLPKVVEICSGSYSRFIHKR